MERSYIFASPEETMQFAESLGKQCKGGEIFVLASDLGGGKTTFTKGLAAGLGSKDVVNSPTFTVSRIYACHDNIELHHFDFYRLQEAGLMAHELADALGDPSAIVVVEWGGVVNDVLPERRVTIKFERMAEDENRRRLTLACPDDLAYLLKDL